MARYAIVGGPDAYWVRDTATGTSVTNHGMTLEEAQICCRRENKAEREHQETIAKLRNNDHS